MTKPIIDASKLDGVADRSPIKSEYPSILRMNATATSADLLIYGEIGGFWGDGVDTQKTIEDLLALDVPELNVKINSPGGSVFDGITIYNGLATFPGKVNVMVEGVAASIASVIAMAGDTIKIGEAANFMIHKPWSFVIGDANAMRKEADVLDNLEGGITDIYVARTGADRKQLQDWVAAETWFRGAAAVDAGFADEVIPAKSKKASAARSQIYACFRHPPADLFATQEDEPRVRVFERALKQMGFSASEAKIAASAASKEFAAERDVPTIGHRDDAPPPVDDAALWQLANHIRKHSV